MNALKLDVACCGYVASLWPIAVTYANIIPHRSETTTSASPLSITLTFPADPSADFGYAHLSTLIKSCNFPWLLSNIVDTDTGRQPDAVQRFVVFEKKGVKVAVIGLVEKDWIATIRRSF